MKKAPILCLFLAMTFMLGSLCGCNTSDKVLISEVSQTYDDAELARAVELGIGHYKESDDSVIYAEFVEMLDAVVVLSSEETFENWEDVLEKARKSQREMTRREGMVAVYLAAESLGLEYYQYNNTAVGTQIFEEIASVDEWLFWNEMWDCDFSLFPNVEAMPLNGEASYVNAAYFYSMNRASLFNGQPIFDYDSDVKSMRPADPFTYTEALRAAVRLYDSYQTIKSRPMTAEDQEIISNADARRETI